jgi:SAM-dependent methyltransferase
MESSDQISKIVVGNEIFWEYQGERYPEICRCGNACAHISAKAEQYCDGVGLDVGAGLYPFSGAFPIRDSMRFKYISGKQIKRANPLPSGIDAYNLSCFVDGSMDYIFSSHCLEHLDKPFDALQLWVSKLKKNGVMFLYLPHPDMKLWNPGAPWVKGAHRWIPKYEILVGWFFKLGLKVIDGSPAKDGFFSFRIVGRKNG